MIKHWQHKAEMATGSIQVQATFGLQFATHPMCFLLVPAGMVFVEKQLGTFLTYL